jgi:dihydroorotate dehydrogenase electron transfer subunit
MSHRSRCPILSCERLRDGFFLLALEAPEIAADCSPGQFVMLRSEVAGWPYLGRPFSIYASDGEAVVQIVYKVVGRATAAMSKMNEGDELILLGPLGEGFTCQEHLSRVICLAGGIGMPPIGFFCQRYVGVFEKMTLVIGARTREELLIPVGLVVEGVEIRSYTEDGSKGTRGTVVQGLLEILDRSGAEGKATMVVACGPKGMLYQVATISTERRLHCQVSVEEMMACGVGACLSCAVPASNGGYLHACRDGPVFESNEIDWKRWIMS